MCLQDGPADRKADAHSFFFCGFLERKHPLRSVDRETRACIGHCDDNPAFLFKCDDSNGSLLAVVDCLAGVAQDIDQDLLDLNPIAFDGKVAWNLIDYLYRWMNQNADQPDAFARRCL